MLRVVGFTNEDFQKLQMGIVSTWNQSTPCNMHINALADEVAKSARIHGVNPLYSIPYITIFDTL